MCENLSELSYVIIESHKEFKYSILGLILSIQYHIPHCQLILAVSPSTRNFLESYPGNFNCCIEYLETDHIYSSNFNLVRKYYHLLYESAKHVLPKYKRVLFVNENTVMTAPITIPTDIEEQGYGFIHKYFRGHNIESKFKEYSFELLFMNSDWFIDSLASMIKEKFTIDISSLEGPYKEITMIDNAEMPLHFTEQFSTDTFIPKQCLIASEDFLGFKDELQLKNISPQLIIGNTQVSFISIRIEKAIPVIKQLNKDLLTLITKYNGMYIPLMTLKNFNDRLSFNVPELKHIGVWSRESDPAGLYQVIDYLCTEHSAFFSQKKIKNNYFNFCGQILYDKPDMRCLTVTMNCFGGVYYFNTDDQCQEEMKEHLKIPIEFLFYHADYPLEIHTFRKENDFGPRSDEKLTVNKAVIRGKTRYTATGRRGMLHKTFIKLLSRFKYAHLKTMDIGLIITCISLGVVPILKSTLPPSTRYLEEGKHYLTEQSIQKGKYEIMAGHLEEFYCNYIDLERVTTRLLDHIFIRDIQ
jgi:hypothetical protein